MQNNIVVDKSFGNVMKVIKTQQDQKLEHLKTGVAFKAQLIDGISFLFAAIKISVKHNINGKISIHSYAVPQTDSKNLTALRAAKK